MSERRGWRRVGVWAGRVALVLLGLFVLARVGVGVYLGTAAGKEMVARQLSGVVGLPVEVSDVSLGMSGTRVRFRVLDPALPREDGEILAVESAAADLTFTGMLQGRTDPKAITLRGATLTVRLSADNDLRTTLPKSSGGSSGGPQPKITLDDCRVRVKQDGKPEFALAGVNLRVTPEDERLVLSGTIDDATWGKWAATGDVNATTKAGAVELKTDDAPLAVESLATIPFVPASVWKHIRPAGRGGIGLRLAFDTHGDVTYGVAIRPRGADLGLPDADITLTDLNGTIRVAGKRLDLTDCRAAVAGGTVTATGSAEFGETTTVDTAWAVNGLDVNAVPPSWGVPKDYGGKLKGEARIRLAVGDDDRIDPSGSSGRGELVNAKVAGFPAEVKLHLGADRGRLKLNRGEGPPASQKSAAPAAPLLAVLLSFPTAEVRVQPPKDKKPADAPTKLDADITLRDVEIGELLKRLEVSTPVALAGKVTVAVAVSVPVADAGSSKAYAFKGSVSSPEFTVNGLRLTDAEARIEYANGKATLSALKAKVPNGNAVPGAFSGTASAAIDPPGDVTASLVVDRLPPGELLKAVPDLGVSATGVVSGKAAFTAPYKGISDPTTWTASANLNSEELVVAGRPVTNLKFSASIEKGRLTVPVLSAGVFGGTVGGSLEYPFDPKTAGKFDVSFKAVDAAAATAIVPDSPVRLTGRVTGSVSGTIAPQSESASRVGDLSVKLGSDKLTVQGIPADELVGTATVQKGVIDFALQGKSLGGSFDVKGTYPGQKKKDGQPAGVGRNSVHLRGIDLSRIGPALRSESLLKLRGTLDLTFDADADLANGGGRVLLTGLAWGDASVAREARGVFVLDDGQLFLRELSGLVGGGQLGVRGRVSLTDPKRNFVAIELRRASARQLFAPLPSVAEVIDGQLSAVVRLTYNRELRGEGTVTVHRGKIVGVGVDDLRVPFRLAWTRGGSAQLTVREASTRAGSGRLQAEATVAWGSSLFVNAQVRFAGVPVQTVAPSLGENALVGAGRITGRFDLTGSNVRTADDLSGTLVAAFQGTSPTDLPLFGKVIPYLTPLGLTRPFDTGDVRANLSRGVLRIQRLALVSPNAQVFAGGTVTTGGRVDLAVTAHTGQIGPGVSALRLFGLRLPAIGPVPLGLIAEVSAFLSNRTVRLEVAGTTDAPVVRVNTRALLTNEAVRFFLGRYVLPAEAADVFGTGAGGLLGGGR